MNAPLRARFEAKVERTAYCWLWTASVQSRGYGQIRQGGAPVLAHRVAYELYVGPIPDGLHIDHLCRNQRCVNPDHLEPVTNRENTLRGVGFAAVNAHKTHCKHGHPFDEENTRVKKQPGRLPNRVCRACNRRHVREARRKARATS